MADHVQRLIPKLRRAAKLYEEHLADRSFLLVGMPQDGGPSCKLLEVAFTDASFQHLVGVRLRSRDLGSRDLYERCLRGTLAASELEEISRGWARVKLDTAPLLFRPDLGATMFGTSNESHLLVSTDMLAGGIRGAMGFVRRKRGNLVPNTLLGEDIRRDVYDLHRVVAAFRKGRHDGRYDEVTKRPDPRSWLVVADGLPPEYAYLNELVREGSVTHSG